jgi:hypothetical protein
MKTGLFIVLAFLHSSGASAAALGFLQHCFHEMSQTNGQFVWIGVYRYAGQEYRIPFPGAQFQTCPATFDLSGYVTR